MEPDNGRHLRMISIILLTSLLSLSGCSMLAPSPRSDLSKQLPASFSLYSVQAVTEQPVAWWSEFGSTQLDQLIETALGDNFSVRQAWARLQQAQASAVKSGANQWPDLTLTSEASHYRQATSSGSGFVSSSGEVRSGGAITDGENYSLGLTSSYELDLWGRVHAATESSALESQASQFDWQTAVVTMTAEVSEHWLRIIAQQQQIAVAKQQITAANNSLKLIRWRFLHGQSPRIDVIRQQEQLAQRQVALAPLEQELQRLQHQLNLLLGQPPRNALALTDRALPVAVMTPDIGLPADLLAWRPDVRAAGLRLQSADWQVSAARADRLPAIRLTASGSLQSPQVSELFDNWLLNLAGSLTGPIFDGRYRAAEVARTRAVVDERLARYEQAVLTALTEVENALLAEQKLAEQLVALTRQLDSATQVVNASLERYAQGIVDYRTVLSDQQTLYALQLQQLQLQRDLLLARVDLHRALGGQRMTMASDPSTQPTESAANNDITDQAILDNKGSIHG